MKNKKGFTLVELLAVIVILALIMGIAVVSIGGVLTSSREKTFRETAASLINGVRQQLYIENKVAVGGYCFDATILEKGGKESSYGGTLNYSCSSGETIGGSVKKLSATPSPKCKANEPAYVYVAANGNNFKYWICLSDGTHYIFSDEESLLNNKANLDVIPSPAP